ncbi:hypothetical protein K503DRAFT_857284 [Rhizopogon vinicolor AM-OR11-026]|uniref:DUF6533 domain-containing protein n=1 Tax=Rhizopogon vinicolor AM-OR11-026 TaxID=1314800 RepID=A0A1B7MY84_9AGAM|nr:hypothetical protein K503DRAFT_857284 [Rhizopogon vinicolor AM-OR11-026]
MSDVVVDNSPDWWPILQAIQLSNCCSSKLMHPLVAAAALVWYDYSLLFTREVNHVWRAPWSFMSSLYVVVRYLGRAPWSFMSSLYVVVRYLGMILAINYFIFNANIYMAPSIGVAIDRFENFGKFGFQMISQAIMSMRIYAMYMQSRRVLVLLSIFFLATAGLGIAVGITVLGPDSGISATEFVLSGISVCGPYVNTASVFPLAYDILGLCTTILQFALAVGRFVKHALEMRQMLHRWQVNGIMKVLVQDSIIYFSLNLISTVIFMISVWGPQDSTYFAVITAYTQNQSSVLVPRLVISFREHHSHGDHLDRKHSQDLEMRGLEG